MQVQVAWNGSDGARNSYSVVLWDLQVIFWNSYGFSNFIGLLQPHYVDS